MDMSQYKDEYINEVTDHLDKLNQLLIDLEKYVDNREILDDIFRSFHTIKGNSATMGFLKYSELAHVMEDLLDLIRTGKLDVNGEIVDKLLEGLDLLEDGLEVIKTEGTDNISIHDIVKDFKDLMGQEGKSGPKAKVGETVQLSQDESTKVSELKNSGKNVIRLIIHFEDTLQQVPVKAKLALREIKKMSEIISTNPTDDENFIANMDHDFEIILSTEQTNEEVLQAVNKLVGIKEANIIGVDEKYERKEELKAETHEEKEIHKDNLVQKHSQEFVKKIQSVKVDIKRLDNLMNHVGELLINKIRLDQIAKDYQLKELDLLLTQLDRLTMDIQDEVMVVRMVPIGHIFNRFPRMVRDLAKKEEKNVEIVIEGDDIEFDRTILDQIGDPLVHLLRNSIDHGIEKPAERVKGNKGETGLIKLIARREKQHATIDIIDDGAGIDGDKVAASAVKKGILSEDEVANMTDKEKQRLIFKAGLSTNEVVTDVSGRGVGMDVVENKIRAMGGTVRLESEVCKGTTISLQLPLTVAIISALMIKLKDDVYAVPLSAVNRTVEVTTNDIKTIQKNEVFVLREKEIPLIRLHRLFAYDEDSDQKKFTVIIVDKDDSQIGFVVDEIVSQQQILIKSLDQIVKGIKGFSGATILGDGTVAMILDTDSLT